VKFSGTEALLSRRFFFLVVLLMIATTQSCTSQETSPSAETKIERPPITERLLGTWISSELGYPMKMTLTADGSEELFVSILDPVPLFRSEYEIDDKWTDDKGIEWLALTYYWVEPFREMRQVQSYAIVTVSGDGTRMVIGWKERGRPKQTETADYAQLFYREGTERANGVKDLPTRSSSVAIERSEPAYMVFVGVPDDETHDLLKKRMETVPNIEMLPWSDFVPIADDIVSSFVIHDDYKAPSLIPGIIALLRTYPMMEIGLTWNSGIAITATDFYVAGRYYERFTTDPVEYNRTKIPYDITHNPLEHLGGLLGW
jgi:hypothetical protein